MKRAIATQHCWGGGGGGEGELKRQAKRAQRDHSDEIGGTLRCQLIGGFGHWEDMVVPIYPGGNSCPTFYPIELAL